MESAKAKWFIADPQLCSTNSPPKVMNAALASRATEDGLGPWLASHWGDLADALAERIDQIEF